MDFSRVERLDDTGGQSPSATYAEQQLDFPGTGSADQMNSLDFAVPIPFQNGEEEAHSPLRGFMSDWTFGPGLGVTQSPSFDFSNTINQDGAYNINQHSTLMTRNSSMNLSWNIADFTIFDVSFLDDLPFQRFRNSVANRGKRRHPRPSSTALVRPECAYHTLVQTRLTGSPGINLSSLRPQRNMLQSYGASPLVKAFLRDVAETEASLSDSPGLWRSLSGIQPINPLSSFHSLLPGEPNERQTDLITKDAMLDTNFLRLLLFSVANGFAGLGDIPVASILRFLTRYGDVDTLFSQVLQSSPNHVAKSLAENLVKAAIEAQQSHIVKYLLDTRLLRINDLYVEPNGWKLTALERAAELRDFKTVKVLLAAHADVEKSYGYDPRIRGPLILLIHGISSGETISSDTIGVLDALLHHGAKIDMATLETVLKRVRNSNLFLLLISHILETHETDLVGHGILPLVTMELDENEAYEATEKIISACGRLHKYHCLEQQESETEWALVQSARRGHTRAVQLLLPYTTSFDRVLSASFHSGKAEIVDLVLAKGPDFNASAHSIDEKEWSLDNGRDWFWTVTTPLAEALRTRNPKWIQLCEDSDTLQHLHLIGHFAAALAAAATIGDLHYVRTILRHRPEPPQKEMYVALVFSIENSHDEISSLLIEAGANLDVSDLSDLRNPPPWISSPSISPPWLSSRRSRTPLLAAVLQRNIRVVHMILDAGCKEYTSAVFTEMMRWGDRSIISDFGRAFPTAGIALFGNCEIEKEILSKDFLAFLMDEGLVDQCTLNHFLGDAIKEDDTAMVYHLLDLGANPLYHGILGLAVENERLEILVALLDNIQKRPARLRGLGTEAIIMAIQLGLPGLRMVETLLASGFIDVHCVPEEFSESPLGTAIKMADNFTSDFIVVKRLLQAGCDPNSVVAGYEDYNLTAVLAAVQTKSVGLVQLLLDHGANANAEAIRRLRRTPLQEAAESGCLDIVQLLLEKGANVNALPARRGGGTALQLAAISGNCNIAAELLKRDADPSMPPSVVRGRWPLEGAAEHGRLDMIELLLRLNVYGVDQCNRAAKFAGDNGHFGCQDLLLEHVAQQGFTSQFSASDLDHILGSIA
jgi:ankyrin repeat protein